MYVFVVYSFFGNMKTICVNLFPTTIDVLIIHITVT